MADAPASWVETMADCIEQIAEGEPDDQHFASHFLLCRKVLREPTMDSIKIAAAMQHVKLTRGDVLHMAATWDDVDLTRPSAIGGVAG